MGFTPTMRNMRNDLPLVGGRSIHTQIAVMGTLQGRKIKYEGPSWPHLDPLIACWDSFTDAGFGSTTCIRGHRCLDGWRRCKLQTRDRHYHPIRRPKID